MNHKLCLLSALGIAASLPALASAAGFTGTFSAPMIYEDDVYTGVSFSDVSGEISVTGGVGPGDLNLSFSFGSVSASVPLVIDSSGKLATLAPGSHTVGTATVRDTYLFSDGNNMALAYVAADDSSGTLSYVVSSWQQTPSLADPESAVGRWDFTSIYSTSNLGGGSAFQPGNDHWFPLRNTGSGYAILEESIDFNVPLAATPGNFSLASAPVRAGSGDWHALHWVFDQHGRAAIFFIGVELDDVTDVGISVGLLTQAVPEPETYVMFLAGLGLLGFAARQRVRAS